MADILLGRTKNKITNNTCVYRQSHVLYILPSILHFIIRIIICSIILSERNFKCRVIKTHLRCRWVKSQLIDVSKLSLRHKYLARFVYSESILLLCAVPHNVFFVALRCSGVTRDFTHIIFDSDLCHAQRPYHDRDNHSFKSPHFCTFDLQVLRIWHFEICFLEKRGIL